MEYYKNLSFPYKHILNTNSLFFDWSKVLEKKEKKRKEDVWHRGLSYQVFSSPLCDSWNKRKWHSHQVGYSYQSWSVSLLSPIHYCLNVPPHSPYFMLFTLQIFSLNMGCHAFAQMALFQAIFKFSLPLAECAKLVWKRKKERKISNYFLRRNLALWTNEEKNLKSGLRKDHNLRCK